MNLVDQYLKDQVDQFLKLFADLAHQAGIDEVCAVEFTKEMDKTHRRNCRRYAEVDPESLHFYFAPQIIGLSHAHQAGLIMHELGHVLCKDMAGGGTEDDADRAAEETFGVKIRYDRRWPGKGLQYVNYSR